MMVPSTLGAEAVMAVALKLASVTGRVVNCLAGHTHILTCLLT